MKKLLTSICLITTVFLTSQGQDKTGIRFGIKGGYNIATQYGITPEDLTYDVSSESLNGFSGGIMLLFPITNAFAVQQEYIYSNKGSVQNVSMTLPPEMGNTFVSTSTEYQINYFEMPIVFRYTFAKIGNVGIYGCSGFALSMLLDGEYTYKQSIQPLITTDGINFEPGPVVASEKSTQDIKELDEFDYSFVYGLGAHFKLLKQTFFVDYRQVIGWNTLQLPVSPNSEDTAPLRNQNYTISLGMYFW
ncbi:porin family protein [Carboxylicivirga marina]|uniref:PorT family protein n=1 Tax=Carboxylicivirga marina TaxID=2800988 RepID=A0ABS1HEI4_9BACT|nr:porin family protein [Carboxylicivirga marina]MBK3515728.1 PorT family protein [Carboxylicivirga marina]